MAELGAICFGGAAFVSLTSAYSWIRPERMIPGARATLRGSVSPCAATTVLVKQSRAAKGTFIIRNTFLTLREGGETRVTVLLVRGGVQLEHGSGHHGLSVDSGEPRTKLHELAASCCGEARSPEPTTACRTPGSTAGCGCARTRRHPLRGCPA